MLLLALRAKGNKVDTGSVGHWDSAFTEKQGGIESDGELIIEGPVEVDEFVAKKGSTVKSKGRKSKKSKKSKKVSLNNLSLGL